MTNSRGTATRSEGEHPAIQRHPRTADVSHRPSLLQRRHRVLASGTDLAACSLAVALVGPTSPGSALLAGAVILGLAAVVLRAPVASLTRRLPRGWSTLAGSTGGAVLLGALALPDHAAEIAALSAAMLLACLLGRTALRLVVLARWRRRRDLQPTLIVGAGAVGQALARVLRGRPEFGLAPIGFVDDVSDHAGPVPLLGSPERLDELLDRTGATTVVLAFGPTRDPHLVRHVREATMRRERIRVFALPRFFELGIARRAVVEHVWGYPLVELSPPPHQRATWRLKRAVDVVVAGLLLAVLSPLFAGLAMAVRLSGPGPVIFRQERVGLRGQPIQMLKFRTMRPATREGSWVADPDRITGVGRVLRPTHLDELPQLVNVLRGEMSLVGPRPERPTYVDHFSDDVPGYRDRHRVPVGMTGLAQVNGLLGDTSIPERARFDNRYIEDWSLFEDLRILGRTLSTLIERTTPESAVGPEPREGQPGERQPGERPATDRGVGHGPRSDGRAGGALAVRGRRAS